MRSFQSLIFLHISVSASLSADLRYSVGIILINISGYWTVGRSQELLFLGSFLDWKGGVCQSESRSPMTHSCFHAPNLWAGTLCSMLCGPVLGGRVISRVGGGQSTPAPGSVWCAGFCPGTAGTDVLQSALLFCPMELSPSFPQCSFL